MKAILLSVGKTDDDFYAQAIDVFKKRLGFYIPFDMEFVPDLKNTKKLSEKEQKNLEGEGILNRLQPGDYVVLLDDKGKQYSSVEFARFMEKKSQLKLLKLVVTLKRL